MFTKKMQSDKEKYADWMSALPEELLDVSLFHLAIPGSHDAMSSCLDITSPLLRSESDTFRCLDSFLYCFTRPAIFRWATTQHRNIAEQLNAGIRYFDFRIGHKQNDFTEDLYFTHVIYTSFTVLETLLDIAFWLKAHPKEVVILACSHFEGLSEELHNSFICSIKMVFSSKLCPYAEGPVTLRGLWASGYQVLLSYEDPVAEKHRQLWPAIPYWWANQHTAEGVCSYLDFMKEAGRPEGFFVSGLNLTASRGYITMHPCESLWSLTKQQSGPLLDWVQKQRPGGTSDCINIIAGDFVGSVPFCPLVITLNQKLLQARIP